MAGCCTAAAAAACLLAEPRPTARQPSAAYTLPLRWLRATIRPLPQVTGSLTVADSTWPWRFSIRLRAGGLVKAQVLCVVVLLNRDNPGSLPALTP
jgi:hypothetical protein